MSDTLKELLDGLREIKIFYGEDLVSLILGVDNRVLRRWLQVTAGPRSKPLLPNENQRRYIAALLETCETLMVLSRQEQKMWWVSFSYYYLFGIPAEEFIRRPNDVRLAAMMKVSGQEDMEMT